MLARERKGPASIEQAAEGKPVAAVPGHEETPDCRLDLRPAAGDGTRPGSHGGRSGDGSRRSRSTRPQPPTAWPAPRKSYERRSKLDPFKDTIDAMLLPEANGSGNPRRTVKEIFDRLVAEHMMTSVSYATVRDYVTSRRPIQSSGSSHADSNIRDAQLMIMHLKGLFGRMTPGIADEAEPHLNALELVIR